MNLRIIKTDKPMRDPAVAAIRDRLRGGVVSGGSGRADVPAVVRGIVSDVRSRGDQAVIEWTAKLDQAELAPETLRVPQERIQQAHASVDKGFLELIRRVSDNIRRYQQHIMIKSPPSLKRGGRELGVRYTPLKRAGVYVPGGRAMYPSTVLMTVIPAQVAGVAEIALVSPPTSRGDVNPTVLALAAELGVMEVYRVGGAQAIAALAMGTPSIPAVDKIVGPGNAFVAEAKRQVFGQVGIDSIAGPSEVLIVADDSAPAEWVAADMLAQAEHDPGSAILVTTSERLADEVVASAARQLPKLERSCAIAAAMEDYSAIIVVPDIDSACELADDFSTEHLQIITADNESTLAKIHNAGAIFIGAETPVPLGDYYAGPSHVLPTGGTGRFFGPLSVNDFIKASSVIKYDVSALAQDADDVIDFARREGLTAHARAVEIREQRKTD